MRIIFATGNADKMREIREIYGDTDYEIVSMKEAGIDVDIVEDGETFEENAMKKARAVFDACGGDSVVLADDSGLEVDYLGGEPGIYSARYLGEDTPYSEKNRVIIERLSGVPKEERTARFVCTIAAVFPDGHTAVKRGTIEGYIGWESVGENGFGYDPYFFYAPLGKSFAELSADEKNAVSHRKRALLKLREALDVEDRSRI